MAEQDTYTPPTDARARVCQARDRPHGEPAPTPAPVPTAPLQVRELRFLHSVLGGAPRVQV